MRYPRSRQSGYVRHAEEFCAELDCILYSSFFTFVRKCVEAVSDNFYSIRCSDCLHPNSNFKPSMVGVIAIASIKRIEYKALELLLELLSEIGTVRAQRPAAEFILNAGLLDTKSKEA